MTIGCKLWLLAVVYVAFLYQYGPQGNGVLCAKDSTSQSDEDQSSGTASFEDVTVEQGDDDEQPDFSNQKGNTSKKNDIKNNHKGSSEDDKNRSGGFSDGDGNDDDDDDDDDDDKKSHSCKDKNYGRNKNNSETFKKSNRGKNNQCYHNESSEDHEDDEDGENSADEDDEESKEHNKKSKKSKKNNDKDITKLQIFTTTTITGRPKEVLSFLNAGVRPYKSDNLDFKKKSNSKLLKKIYAITNKNHTSNEDKYDTSNEDLTHYIRKIVKESAKKKNSKIDSDKILISLVKSILYDILKGA